MRAIFESADREIPLTSHRSNEASRRFVFFFFPWLTSERIWFRLVLNCSIACWLKFDSHLQCDTREAREVIASFSFVFFCFLFDTSRSLPVCTKRWRSSWPVWMIYLPWKFIDRGVYYGDFHVPTQVERRTDTERERERKFICSCYFDKKMCEPFPSLLSSSVILLIAATFLFSFSVSPSAYLFIRHIQPRHWHVILCWRWSGVVGITFFSLVIVWPRNEIDDVSRFCSPRTTRWLFLAHLCVSSKKMRRESEGEKPRRKC